MSTLSEAYNDFINTGTTGTRPGGDKINIAFTSGKKSNKGVLEELQIAAAQREAAEAAATPVDAAAQRLQWEKEDQALQATQDARNAAQAEQELALNMMQEKRAAAAARLSEETGRFQLAQERQAAPIKYASAQESLTGSRISNQRAALQHAAEKQAWDEKQQYKYDWDKGVRFNQNPLKFAIEEAKVSSVNPFTGQQMGLFERNTGQTPEAVLRSIQSGGRNVAPSQWAAAYNVLGPQIASGLYNQYQVQKTTRNPSYMRAQYGFG